MTATFGDIRRDRRGRPADLRRESGIFSLGRRAGHLIKHQHEPMRLAPHAEFSIVLHVHLLYRKQCAARSGFTSSFERPPLAFIARPAWALVPCQRPMPKYQLPITRFPEC